MKLIIVLIMALLCSGALLFIIHSILIKTVLALLIIAIGIFIISYVNYRTYFKNKIPNILLDPIRNYDKLILGVLPTPKKFYYGHDSGKNFDLTNYKRNMYTDILIMERYYSFLKKRGTICFCIDCNNKKYLLQNKISIYDYDLLHQVTLLEHNVNIHSLRYRLMRYYSIFNFIFCKLHNITGKRYNLSDTEIQNIVNKIDTISHFCNIRDLEVEINILNSNSYLRKRLLDQNRYSNVKFNFI